MFKKILIVGCGLIGSSILRGSFNRKISKKVFVYEKSKKNISKIKKINSKAIILKELDNKISDIDFVILSTPMSQYEKIIPYLNNFLSKKSIITDVGSTKQNVIKLKNKKLNKSLDWILSHPISGSEVSGPEYGTICAASNAWIASVPVIAHLPWYASSKAALNWGWPCLTAIDLRDKALASSIELDVDEDQQLLITLVGSDVDTEDGSQHGTAQLKEGGSVATGSNYARSG